MRNGRNFNEKKNPARSGQTTTTPRNYKAILIYILLVGSIIFFGLTVYDYFNPVSTTTETQHRTVDPNSDLLKEVHSDKLKTYYFIQNGTYYKGLSNDTWSTKIEISQAEYQRATN